MEKIYKEHTGDNKLWCAVKHSIGVYEYATECLYAHKEADVIRTQIQQDAYEHMVSVL